MDRPPPGTQHAAADDRESRAMAVHERVARMDDIVALASGIRPCSSRGEPACKRPTFCAVHHSHERVTRRSFLLSPTGGRATGWFTLVGIFGSDAFPT